MTWHIELRDAAKGDIRAAAAWYGQQREGLDDEFLMAVAAGFQRLEEEDPAALPIYYREFRRLLLKRFPYKVFFLIREQTVVVFRVLHVARDHTRAL